MRTSVLFLSIAAATAAVVSWIVAGDDLTPPPAGASAASTSPTSSVRAHDVLARARLRDLSARVDDLAARDASAPSTGTTATSATIASSEPDDEEIAAEMAAREDAMKEAIRTGPRDAWAAESETSLAAAYRSLQDAHAELPMSLSEVACSAELCRVVLAVAGPGAPADALGVLTSAVPWPGERLFKAVPGDRPEVIIYAARDGIPLPR
jgi:hypothetical protein